MFYTKELLVVTQSVVWRLGAFILGGVISAILYYLRSEQSKTVKKQVVDDILGHIIRLVLMMWTIKIIRHFSLFLNDPLAVLAYPSDTNTFYLGLMFVIIIALVEGVWKKKDVLSLLPPFFYMLFLTLFVYESYVLFIQQSMYSFPYYLVLASTIMSYLIFSEKRTVWNKTWWAVSIWTLGSLVIFPFQSLVTIVQFRMLPLFALLLFVSVSYIYIKQERR